MTYHETYMQRVHRNLAYTTLSVFIWAVVIGFMTWASLKLILYPMIEIGPQAERAVSMLAILLEIINAAVVWILRGLRQDSLDYSFHEMGHMAKIAVAARMTEVIHAENEELNRHEHSVIRAEKERKS